jgi:hypothetical protein
MPDFLNDNGTAAQCEQALEATRWPEGLRCPSGEAAGHYVLRALDFQKYAARYLAAFCYRFNRRFDLRTLHQRLLNAGVTEMPRPLRLICVACVHC